MFALSAGPGTKAGWANQIGEALRGSNYPLRTWTDCGATGRLPAEVVVRVPGFLPEDRYDQQPLLSPDDDTVFVCQARLDNRDDLFSTLAIQGSLGEIPDSLLLQQAYLRWGESCLDHIYGDFAFAAYIRSRGQVFCAVDHGNHYRLFYLEDGGRILLGTQLAALTQGTDLTTSVDPTMLGLLAEARGPRNRTPFREIQALAGGYALRWQAGHTALRRWWNPQTKANAHFSQPEDYVECARELFNRAVQSCLRSSTPVSSTVSGGLDSSLVTATAAKLLQSVGAAMTVYTSAPDPANQCYRRPGWEPDDTPYAMQTVALYPNLQHVILRSDCRVALDLMPSIHQRSATPVRNGANHLWLDRIARSAFESGSRVILTGAHGNFGLSHTGLGAFRELFLELHWRTAARIAANLGHEEQAHWKIVVAGVLPQKFLEYLEERRQQRRHPEKLFESLTTTQFKGKHADDLRRNNEPARSRSEFIRRAISPSMLWSADALPQWGVELRDPTGDRRLLETLLTFPLAAFTHNGRWRGLARELGRDLLPNKVRLRKTQGQQAADYACAVQLQTERYRAHAANMAASSACRDILDISTIERAIDAIAHGETSAILTGQLDRACDAGLFLLAHSP